MEKSVYGVCLVILILSVSPFVAKANDSLRLSGSKVISVLPLIASEEGFFKEEGIEIDYQNIEVGKFNMDAILAGSVDIGVIVDSNIAFNSFNENDLVAFGSIMTYQANGIIANNTLGSSKDLRGKRIGFFPATTSHLYLLYYLRTHGLRSKDIFPRIIQPPAMLQALKEGSVDAVSIWNPWRYNILRTLGSKADEFPLDKTIYPARAYLATTRTYLNGHKELIQRFARVLKKAESYTKNNPEEIYRRYAKWNNMDVGTVDAMKECLSIEFETGGSIEKMVQDDIEVIKAEMLDYQNRGNRPASESFDHFLNK